MEFLWGETQGNLEAVELLPVKPYYEERCEELSVHARTGFVDREGRFPASECRPVWVWVDDKGAREPKFAHCAMCQESGHSKARIHDFRTRGEHAFTALVEAQFAEQPPQNLDTSLPNHGRKVLVFSDGRQKAARLAPALEHSHARDLFRQVIVLALTELQTQLSLNGLNHLYFAVVWLCANRGYELFPGDEANDELVFRTHLDRVRGKSLQ